MTANNEATVVTAEASLLSQLLYKGKLEVPWHQRKYDWSRENVSELLIDLDEAFRENRESYFLGAIVLVEKSDRSWEINDGQQRIVTYSLICARLARMFANGVDPQRESIALRNLFNLSTDHTESLTQSDMLEPRVSPPQDNRMNFRLLLRGHNIGTNGKLTTAWNEIDRHFLPVDVEKAKQFFDFVVRKLEVVCISVPKRVDPNSVFETLNARGKPLEDFDLIRNHIYSFFNDDSEQQRRDTVHEGLERLRQCFREGPRTMEYTRCFLQCEYGYLPKDQLYRKTKMQIKRKIDESFKNSEADYVFQLTNKFTEGESTAVFNSIYSPREDDTIISRFIRDAGKISDSRNAYYFLHDLKHYKVTQPIVFALLVRYLRELDGRKRKAVARRAHIYLKALTSFVMRTALATQKFEPSDFESGFSALARDIMSADSLDSVPFASTLWDSDKNEVFYDCNFIQHMKQATIKESRKAKRFLLGLVYHQQDDLNIISENKYTVEHILPTSPEHLKGWAHFDPKEHKDNIHLLGNLTLLSDRDNKPGAAYNRSFEKKKTIFEASLIKMTNEVSRVSEWSPAEIQNRQLKMARLACNVWDFPEELRKK